MDARSFSNLGLVHIRRSDVNRLGLASSILYIDIPLLQRILCYLGSEMAGGHIHKRWPLLTLSDNDIPFVL
jgi:hypothetical protein